MKRYLNIEIERNRSKYPRGLRHYSKEGLVESILFDHELASYKIKGIAKGQNNDEERRERNKTQDKKNAREILRGFMQRLLHQDRETVDREAEIRAITERYISLDEREREERERSDEICETQTEKTKNENRG